MNDPGSAKDLSSDAPSIHPTASVRDTTFGRFNEVGARTKVSECTFGDYAYVVHDAEIIYTTIGPFCSIAAQTRINPGNHPLDRIMLNHVSYRSSAYGLGPDDAGFFDWRRASPVVLGPDVWVGHGAVILPGRTIGTGAAIGAGAIVTKDVPDFAIVVGNPGRVIRSRFPPEICAALLRIAFWSWDHATLAERLPDIRRLSAMDFCRRYDPA